MPTVYSRLIAFYEKDRFRFKERDKKAIGMRISALWKELNKDQPHPPRVQSREDSGTYTVFDYPLSFVHIIDQLIRNVHKEILDASVERRRLKELKYHSTSPPSLVPLEPLAPLPKIRKRIPVKNIPAWKGR